MSKERVRELLDEVLEKAMSCYGYYPDQVLATLEELLDDLAGEKEEILNELAEEEEPEPITLESVVEDYCREEADEETEAAAVAEWCDQLEQVGATYDDQSSISGGEVGWEMTLAQAFEMHERFGWFRPDGFYGHPLEKTLAGLLPNVWDANAEAKIKELYEEWKKGRTKNG